MFIIVGNYRRENETELEAKELEIVKLLYKYESNIKIRNNDEQTLLHAAIAQRKYDIARFLIKNRCNSNAVDKSGKTPLFFINTDLTCAEILCENSADPNIQDCDGRTASHELIVIKRRMFRRSFDSTIASEELKTKAEELAILKIFV